MATEDESAAVSDWDLDEMSDEVGCRIELVDGFDELAGETDYWGMSGNMAMEIAEDDAVIEQARGLQAATVGSNSGETDRASWTCSLSVSELERQAQIMEDEYESLTDADVEWMVRRKLAYLASMVVPDKGWKPYPKEVNEYDIWIELKDNTSVLSVRIMFKLNYVD